MYTYCHPLLICRKIKSRLQSDFVPKKRDMITLEDFVLTPTVSWSSGEENKTKGEKYGIKSIKINKGVHYLGGIHYGVGLFYRRYGGRGTA